MAVDVRKFRTAILLQVDDLHALQQQIINLETSLHGKLIKQQVVNSCNPLTLTSIHKVLAIR